MSKNQKSYKGGLVYSTNPNALEKIEVNMETLDPKDQKLKVSLDKKMRAGKTATIIEGFVGDNDTLSKLEKSLKNLCGVGGSSKDGIIIIQGDHKEKILKYLIDKGYLAKSKG